MRQWNKNANAPRMESGQWTRKNNEQPLVNLLGGCILLPAYPLSFSLLLSYFLLHSYLLVPWDIRWHKDCIKKGYERNVRNGGKWEKRERATNTTAKNAISCRECQAELQNESRSSGRSKSSDKARRPSTRIESLPVCSFDCWKAHDCALLRAFGYNRRIVASNRGRL